MKQINCDRFSVQALLETTSEQFFVSRLLVCVLGEKGVKWMV